MQTEAKNTTTAAAKSSVKLRGFLKHCRVPGMAAPGSEEAMLEDTFEEGKLTFSKMQLPASQLKKDFVKTRTNSCCYSTTLPKNSINSYRTDASSADAVKNQTISTTLSEAMHISCCSQTTLAIPRRKRSQNCHSSPSLQTSVPVLWQAGISQVRKCLLSTA